MGGRFAAVLWGLLACALSAVTASAGPMTFRIATAGGCPSQGCIVASGEIGPDSIRDFSRLLRTSDVQPGALVVLNSPGGDLAAGLKLGALIRRAGLDTRVQAVDIRDDAWFSGGRCASACAFAFLGGRNRAVPPDAAYGVHQFRAANEAPVGPAQSQRLAAAILDYLDALQVSPRLASEALKTESHRVRWLMADELSALGVVHTDARLQTF